MKSEETKTKKSTLNLANRITIGRIILIPIFVFFFLSYDGEKEWLRVSAIFIFAVAFLTDALDGFIARTRGEKTELGTFLDPLADKLLLTTSIVLLSLPNMKWGYHLPLWFTVLAISRDAFITMGSLLIHILNGIVRIRPSMWGKLTTVAQMVTIVWILLKWSQPQIWVITAAVLTSISAIDYLIFGSKQLNESMKSS